jgi:lipopolysaccharide export LptBFGC system permease protein LptF
MRFKFPLILWTWIFSSLGLLVLLSTAILVLVIALATAIKPMSDGLLAGTDLPKFIAIACVPMLAYALPFAAGFASTLVYHRIASDNETTACYASGISHRAILLPALAMGITLSVALGGLNEQVIPTLLRDLKKLVTVDIARLLSTTIERGKSVKLDSNMIFADSVRRIDVSGLTIDNPPSDYFILDHFSAIELSKENIPKTEVTAEKAELAVYPLVSFSRPGTASENEGQGVLAIRLVNVVGVQEGRGIGGFRDDASFTIPIANTFVDNVKFLTWGELRTLDTNPERMNWIDAARKDLAYALAERACLELFDRALRDSGTVKLTDAKGREVRLSGGGITFEPPVKTETVSKPGRWRIDPSKDGSPVSVWFTRSGVNGDVPARALGKRATLSTDSSNDPNARRLVLRIDLEQAKSRDIPAGESRFAPIDMQDAAERGQISIGELRYAADVLTNALKKNSRELVGLARATLPNDQAPFGGNESLSGIRRASDDLAAKTSKLSRQVLAKRHERMAMAASCFVMTITGAIAALLRSRRTALTIYLWTFFPALFTIVTISGGQQMTVQAGERGLWLMWSGVVALSVYTLFGFFRLVRR